MLSPEQIGELARLIKVTLEQNPLPDTTEAETFDNDSSTYELEYWEHQLKEAVDQSLLFDSYESIRHDPILDLLLEYYDTNLS